MKTNLNRKKAVLLGLTSSLLVTMTSCGLTNKTSTSRHLNYKGEVISNLDDSLQDNEEENNVILTNQIINEGIGWKADEYWLYINENVAITEDLINAVKFYVSLNPEYGCSIETNSNVDLSSIASLFTKLRININDVTDIHSLKINNFANLKEMTINGQNLKSIDYASLQEIITSLGQNNGSLEIYGDLIDEDYVTFLNLDFKGLSALNYKCYDTYEHDLLNNIAKISATKVVLDLTDNDNYSIVSPLEVNDQTKSFYLSTCASFPENFKIDANHPLDISLYTTVYEDNVKYIFPEDSTLSICTGNALPTEESLSSLKKYQGTFNYVDINAAKTDIETIAEINSISKYVTVKRSEGHNEATLNIPQNGFEYGDACKIYDALKLAYKTDSNLLPDVVINANNIEDINLDDLALPQYLNKLILNLNTKSASALSLITNNNCSSLTINCNQTIDEIDQEKVNDILSHCVFESGNITLNNFPNQILAIDYCAVAPNEEETLYYLNVNGNNFVIKDGVPVLIQDNKMYENYELTRRLK